MDKSVESPAKIYPPVPESETAKIMTYVFSYFYPGYKIPFVHDDILRLKIIKLSKAFKLYTCYTGDETHIILKNFYVGYYFPLYYETDGLEYTITREIKLFDLREYSDLECQLDSRADGPMLSNMLAYIEKKNIDYADGYLYHDDGENGLQIYLFHPGVILENWKIIRYTDDEKYKMRSAVKKYKYYPLEKMLDTTIINRYTIQ